MPDFLIKKLQEEYPNDPHAVWGTLNKRGFVHGNRETEKGREADRKHERRLHLKKRADKKRA